MSGTSADGIDVAVVRIAPGKLRPGLKLLAHEGFAFPAPLRRAVLAAMNAAAISTAELARLHWRLGLAYAEAVNATREAAQGETRPDWLPRTDALSSAARGELRGTALRLHLATGRGGGDCRGPQGRDVRAFSWLLLGEYGSKAVLRIKGLDGNRARNNPGQGCGLFKNHEPMSSSVVNWRPASRTVNLPSFQTNQVVKDFEKIFPQVQKANGLILDIRHNHGGNSGTVLGSSAC